jgi:hypothetical protein
MEITKVSRVVAKIQCRISIAWTCNQKSSSEMQNKILFELGMLRNNITVRSQERLSDFFYTSSYFRSFLCVLWRATDMASWIVVTNKNHFLLINAIAQQKTLEFVPTILSTNIISTAFTPELVFTGKKIFWKIW